MRVGIIGAGLTGLVAAKTLSNQGIQVEVYEKMTVPGGRMRTEEVEGWHLDVGFQVLLSAYPYLKKHVDFSDVNMMNLDAAAVIFRDKNTAVVGDPFRTRGVLLKTVVSSVGSIRDKYLIFKLKRYADRLSVSAIFDLQSVSTLAFLKKFGFSEKIISRFFKPFFGGIFLEGDLLTSSRMFLFIFKMFAEGNAVLPKHGIGSVAENIVNQLKKVIINYNSSVFRIENDKSTLILKNGREFKFDYIINTIPNFGNYNSEDNWQSCYNLYFEHNTPAVIEEVRIGLNANNNRLINNLFYPSSVFTPTSKSGRCLLSVTVIDGNDLSETEIIERVTGELIEDFALSNKNLKFLKLYSIPYSLPKRELPKYEVNFDSYKGTVFHVGDFCANGSQNSACSIGEAIALEIIDRHSGK